MEDYRVLLFLTDGFEETEAITTLDILRRAGIKTASVSITGKKMVASKRDILITSDLLFEELGDTTAIDMLVLPGGAVREGYKSHEGLLLLLRQFHNAGKYISAICAAPTVLGEMGLLEDKMAVCFPSMTELLYGATVGSNIVEKDGHIITSKGPGTTMFFALEIVRTLAGKPVMETIRKDFLIDLL